MSSSDRRLREESPAYSAEESWEALPPQGMDVVVSVRFSPSAARKLAKVAQQAHLSPSALLRAWTHERLAGDGVVRQASRRAVMEAAADYGPAPDNFEVLRDRYRPAVIKVLLVGESRPAGGTFFYAANSHLFFATREAFFAAHHVAAPGDAFLAQLQQEGVWLYDLAASPVNRVSGRPRQEAVEARTANLVQLLRHADPRIVVAIKRSLEPVVRSAMVSAQIDLGRLHVLPFPLYQWRKDYVSGLAAILAPDGGGLGAADDAGELARGRDSGGWGTTQPVTPNDMAKGQIRIPQASKYLLPDARGTLNVVLRGHRLESAYDPRNGPDRPRSGVLKVPRALLRDVVEPYERLKVLPADELITLD